MYSWLVYKRYSNFIDLHEALEPLFRAENITQPRLPPKIELINDVQRNANLTDRKKQLQKYLRDVLELLAVRMPPHLLIFLGLHEQSALGYQNAEQIKRIS